LNKSPRSSIQRGKYLKSGVKDHAQKAAGAGTAPGFREGAGGKKRLLVVQRRRGDYHAPRERRTLHRTGLAPEGNARKTLTQDHPFKGGERIGGEKAQRKRTKHNAG